MRRFPERFRPYFLDDGKNEMARSAGVPAGAQIIVIRSHPPLTLVRRTFLLFTNLETNGFEKSICQSEKPEFCDALWVSVKSKKNLKKNDDVRPRGDERFKYSRPVAPYTVHVFSRAAAEVHVLILMCYTAYYTL